VRGLSVPNSPKTVLIELRGDELSRRIPAQNVLPTAIDKSPKSVYLQGNIAGAGFEPATFGL
jgi:hypothetical protein